MATSEITEVKEVSHVITRVILEYGHRYGWRDIHSLSFQGPVELPTIPTIVARPVQKSDPIVITDMMPTFLISNGNPGVSNCIPCRRPAASTAQVAP